MPGIASQSNLLLSVQACSEALRLLLLQILWYVSLIKHQILGMAHCSARSVRLQGLGRKAEAICRLWSEGRASSGQECEKNNGDL